MPTRPRVHGAAAALAAGLLLAPPLAITGPTPARADDASARVVFLIDGSATMAAAHPGAGTRIAAAKAAVATAATGLPAGTGVGLRVLGTTQAAGKPSVTSCADTRPLRPVGPVDAAFTKALATVAPKGQAPIGAALRAAAADLGAGSSRHIILLADGEDTCVPDPCVVARSIPGLGTDLQVDVVGLGLTPKGRAQLQCIATASNGTLYEAADAETARTSAVRLAQRAIRSLTVAGKPVIGSASPDDAPILTAGQYADRVETSGKTGTHRYYRVRRAIPGSSIRVTTIGRLPSAPTPGGAGWRYTLTTTDGRYDCGGDTNLLLGQNDVGVVATGTVTSWALDPRSTTRELARRACAEASELQLDVQRGIGRADSVPVELHVTEEPPAEDPPLPPGVGLAPRNNGAELRSPTSGSPVWVIGGSGFNDAADVQPGTYVAQIVPGETLFFKTRIDWGQTALIALDGPDPASAPMKRLKGTESVALFGDVFAPDLAQIDSQETPRYATFGAGGKVSGYVRNALPQIRYRNRWDAPPMFFGSSRAYSVAGDYSFSVGLAPVAANHPLRNVPIPVRFAFSVDGSPSDAPVYLEEGGVPGTEVSTTPSASPTTVASPPPVREELPPRPSPWWGWASLGAALALGGGYAVWRRATS